MKQSLILYEDSIMRYLCVILCFILVIFKLRIINNQNMCMCLVELIDFTDRSEVVGIADMEIRHLYPQKMGKHLSKFEI